MAKLDFKEEASSPSTPPAGYIRFYAKTDKYLYYKDDTGVETPVIPLSAEQVQDAIGNILTDTSSVDFTYDDSGNTISATVLAAGVNHNALQNYVANEHINHTSVTISAGEGLTGGGDISANRTISAKIGYMQYGNSSSYTNALTTFSKITIDTDRSSYANGYFTKINTTDIRCDFTGKVLINFTAYGYTDTNDRGYEVSIRHNSSDLAYLAARASGKNVVERNSCASCSFYLDVVTNDTISLVAKNNEAGTTLTIPANNALINVSIVK